MGILRRREVEKERSRSPKKKTPKLVGDTFLSPEQNFKIYTLSATDVSATEDESEQSKSVRTKKSIQSSIEDQPMFLTIPPKPTTESRPGIIKSKSFANPGQFECSIEESAGKKLQMMSFFSGNNNKESNLQERSKPISDDEDDEDLIDIDAEFENLLTKTFERESRKVSSGEKVASRVGAGASGPHRSSAGYGGRGVSLDMSNTGRSVSFESDTGRKLQKSQSFGFNSSRAIGAGLSSVSERHSGITEQRQSRDSQRFSKIRSTSSSPEHDSVKNRNTMYQQKHKNFDPIAALPTSQTKQYHKNIGNGGSPPPHSPSPTQSEYDTCDPWDDY